MSDRALAAARESGLVRAGEPIVVMVSGGADSVCLLDVCVELGAEVSALHVNYGLRGEESDADARLVAALCESLGVPLTATAVSLEHGPGENLQAAARAVRYAAAEEESERRGCDHAAAHTLDDQAETVLYRLATSPGSRALRGMAPRRGRLVRPLLRARREDTRAWCGSRGLAWREDRSNQDPLYARARVRGELLPALESVAPGAADTVAETALQLAGEAELLELLVDAALERLGDPPSLAGLAAEPRALARLVLRRLAERAAGRSVPLGRAAAERALALAGSPSGSRADLGSGLTAVSEHGRIRVERRP